MSSNGPCSHIVVGVTVSCMHFELLAKTGERAAVSDVSALTERNSRTRS